MHSLYLFPIYIFIHCCICFCLPSNVAIVNILNVLLLILSAANTACLKDLQAFLRHDSTETREAFFALGGYNIAKNDLVPILMGHPGDTELVFNACEE